MNLTTTDKKVVLVEQDEVTAITIRDRQVLVAELPRGLPSNIGAVQELIETHDEDSAAHSDIRDQIDDHEGATTNVHGIPNTANLIETGDAAGGSLTGTYPNPTIANLAVTNAMLAGLIGMDKIAGLTDDLDEREVAQAFAVIEFYGHSGTYGGASTGVRGMDQRLGALLKADAWNRTIGGARLSYHDYEWGVSGNGGWTTIYRYTELVDQDASGSQEGGAATPREAKRDAVVLFQGFNDLAQLGPAETAYYQPFRNALKACISRLRAATIFENSDATVTYPTGTWGEPSSGAGATKYSSGSTYSQASSGSVRVAVPADFPGGNIALSFLSAVDGSGALWTITVDGQTWGTVDSRDVNARDYLTNANPRVTPVIARIEDLNPGAHVIVATATTVKNMANFDCWWIEAQEPPLVVLPGFWNGAGLAAGLTEAYGFFTNFPFNPAKGLNSSARQAMERDIQSVADTFDEHVITVPLNDLVDGEVYGRTYIDQDTIHLNDRGHARIAERIAEYMIDARRSLRHHAQGNAQPPYLSANPMATERNIIQSGAPTTTPLTIKGRNAGDQNAALLDLQSGAGSLAHMYLGRTASETQWGVANGANNFSWGASAGDMVLRVVDPAQKLIIAAGSTGRLHVLSDRVKFNLDDSLASGKVFHAGAGYTGFGHNDVARAAIAMSATGNTAVNSETGGIIFQDAGVSISKLTTAGLYLGNGLAAAKLHFPSSTVAAGGIQFGDDTNLYRAAVNILQTDDELRAAGPFRSDQYLFANQTTATNWAFLGLTAAGVYGPGITFGATLDVNLYRAHANVLATDDDFWSYANVWSRIGANQVGMGNLGPASQPGITIGGDCNLYRSSADLLKTDDHFQSAMNIVSRVGSSSQIALYDDSGVAKIAMGNTASQVNLYRGAADVLATDDALELIEQGTEPGTPAANKARLFLRDSGAGITQMIAKFPSGNTVVVAEDF